jgi:hypothetical protein
VSTADGAVRFVASALTRLADSLETPELALSFLRELGWSLATVPPQIAALDTAAGALADLWHRVEYDTLTTENVEQAIEAAKTLWTAIAQLDATADPAGAAGFVADLARTILDYWVIDVLQTEGGIALPVLQLLGVVEIQFVAESLPRARYISRRIRWDRLPSLITDPGVGFRERFGWGTPAFDAATVLGHIREILAGVRVATSVVDPPSNELAAAGSNVTPIAGIDLELLAYEVDSAPVAAGVRFLPLVPATGLPGLALVPYVTGALGETFTVDDHTTVTIDASFDLAGGVVLGWRPDTGLALTIDVGSGGAASSDAHAQITLAIEDPTRPSQTIFDGFGVQVTASVVQGVAKLALSPPSLAIEAELKDGHVHWDSSQMPGVLASLLGDHTVDATANLALGWSSASGFYLRGGAGLSTVIPASITLGPLALRGVRVEVGEHDGALALVVGVDGQLTLGPVSVSWQRLGAQLSVGPGTTSAPLDIDFTVALPDALGIAVAAGPITGVGELAHESPTQYSGLLVISALDITLSALGILEQPTTGGYSLVAVISAQFQPIQLGLGFTLNGVGGLVGVNRRVDGDALRAALHGTGISDIFFPSDPFAQAGRLLGDLATYFPTADGRYVFGPAIKIGWGTPTIVEAELAILLEMPSPIRLFLLGTARIKLPTKEQALIQLEIDVVGELDITEKRLAIDATLRDSRVLTFPIIGDFALRTSWGSQKTLVLSVGGFHSQFRPPPDFPTLRRVRIPIGADDDPRLDITGFLAVTSNTAQIGASIELYASAGPLNIQGNVGFEALFQFSPFAFRVDLSAGVALRRGTTTLASVHLDATLTGTTPWHITGEASLSCWLFDLSVPFTASFGKGVPVVLPPTAIWPLVQPALEDPASWAAELPLAAARAVTTAPPVDATAAEAAAAHIEPTAALTVRQKIVPLDRTVTRFADGAPSDVTQLIVTSATIGTGGASYTPVTDWFAPAQFEDLSDADRLSRDGFELMDAGVSLGSDATLAGSELVVPLEYETVTIAPTTTPPPSRYRPTLLAQLLSGQVGTVERGPQLVALGGLHEEVFAIASSENLTVRSDIVAPGPRGMAELALLAHLSAHPEDVGHVIVVPTHEIVE